MAILPIEDNLRYLTGQTPTLSSAPAEGAGSTQTVQTGSGVPTQTTSTNVTQPDNFQQTQSPRLDLRAGSLQGSILSPVQQDRAGVEAALGRLTSAFKQQAGPGRTFESVQGKDILQAATQPQATPGIMDQAKGLIGAQYQGPTDLPQEDLAGLQNTIQSLTSRLESSRRGGGLTATLGGIPGLTPGAARYEAQKLRYDPAYQAQTQRELEGVRQVGGQIQTGSKEARDLASERQAQEAAIAKQSRQQVEQQRSQLTGTLDRLVEDARARSGETETAYRQALSGHTAALPAGIQEQLRNSPLGEETRKAQAAYQGIMKRYADIADLEPLGLTVNNKGRQVYMGLQGKTEKQKKQLLARQQELEELFGEPQAEKYDAPYRALFPLYFGEELGGVNSPQVSQYLGFDPGNQATRENVASEEQRSRLNQMQDLLGEVDRLEEAGEPLRAASIALDIERFLTDEARTREEREATLGGRRTEWDKQVAALRKKYNKSKEQSFWFKIANQVGFGLPEKVMEPFGKIAHNVLGGIPLSNAAFGLINTPSGLGGGLIPGLGDIPGWEERHVDVPAGTRRKSTLGIGG